MEKALPLQPLDGEGTTLDGEGTATWLHLMEKALPLGCVRGVWLYEYTLPR